MSSIVNSSADLLKGKTSTFRDRSRLHSPIQMVSYAQKDQDWKESNLDWFEHLGLIQLRAKSKRIIKNYNLADGIIDKSISILMVIHFL